MNKQLILVSVFSVFLFGFSPASFAQSTPGGGAASASYASTGIITIVDLGVENVGMVPGDVLYFLKEWRRGIARVFTFDSIKKAEIELKITNEKAAEALKVAETKPDDAGVLAKAMRNFTDATERLEARLAKIKETSENPDVEKLLEKLNEQTLKHTVLFNQFAEKWSQDPYVENATQKYIGDPDFDLIANMVKDAQEKIHNTVLTAVEKEKDIKQKAEEQIKRAEEAIDKLKSAINLFHAWSTGVAITKDEYGIEPAGYAIKEQGIRKAGTADNDNQAAEKTGPIRIDSTPARISTNMTIERQTPKRDFGDRMKVVLDTAGSMLTDAKKAFADGKFGEAFGQARSAEVLAVNGLRVLSGILRSVEGPVEGVACTQQYDPVCGVDGKTYGNACMAKISSVEVKYKGECVASATDSSAR